MLLRQVQAHSSCRHGLRQVRCGSHARQGSTRADGPHRARRACRAHLVCEGHAEPAWPASRYLAAQSGAGALLRVLPGHRGRRRAHARPRSSEVRELADAEIEELRAAAQVEFDEIDEATGTRIRQTSREGQRSVTEAIAARRETELADLRAELEAAESASRGSSTNECGP